MIIIEVKYEKRKRRCLVSLDDERKFYFSTDIITNYRFTKGKSIDGELLTKIINEQRIYDVKQSALNFASYKPRTVWQVRDRLKQKGFENNEINFALDFLKEFELLDDKRYARTFIKDYLLKKSVGKRKIFEELKKRGIDRDIADEALDEVFPEKDKLDLALKSAEKKLRTINHKEVNKQRELLVSHLQRQGFEWDVIKLTLKNLFEDSILH